MNTEPIMTYHFQVSWWLALCWMFAPIVTVIVLAWISRWIRK